MSFRPSSSLLLLLPWLQSLALEVSPSLSCSPAPASAHLPCLFLFSSSFSLAPAVAGLVCASRLAENGLPVAVFDMGRGPGGRMSCRREKTPDGKELCFDHGAQYFTVSNSLVQRLVDKWEAAGFVGEWKGKFGFFDAGIGGFVEDTESSKKRYVAVPAMNAICKALSQQPGIQTKFGVTVTKIEWKDGKRNWLLSAKDGENLGEYGAVVGADKHLASPRFFAQHGVSPPLVGTGIASLTEKVGGVDSSPCFAILLAFSEALTSIPLDGFTVVGSKALAWAARDSSKPGRGINLPDGCECWVLQSTAEYARGIIEKMGLTKPSDELLSSVATTLLMHLRGIAEVPTPIYMRAHRWGSAFPTTAVASDEKCLIYEEKKVAVCGDFCISAKVEGAILSGLAAADKISWLLKNVAPL